MNRIEKRRAALYLIEQLNKKFEEYKRKYGYPLICVQYIKQEFLDVIRATISGEAFAPISFYIEVEDDKIAVGDEDIVWVEFTGNIDEVCNVLRNKIFYSMQSQETNADIKARFKKWLSNALKTDK